MPNPAQSGSTLTLWTLTAHLLGAGHEVFVVVILDDEPSDPGASLRERLQALEALGADVRLVPSSAGEVFSVLANDPISRLRRAWRPSDEQLFPQLVDCEAVLAAVVETGAEVAFVYHWEALAASRGLRGRIPRFAAVVDLPQISSLYRWRMSSDRFSPHGLARLVWLQARLRHQPRLMVELLSECEASANFAAHHAAWLRRRGVSGCEYLRTPVEDRAGPGWRDARRRPLRSERARVLLIGHLRGVSTLDGLGVFAEEILPLLEQRFERQGLEIRLAGGYDPPPHLEKALSRPSVHLLGHLERAHEEFEAADVLLVPTAVPLGTRVRILSAFSFGCPVVAHQANALGIPELAHGTNALLGKTSADLVRETVRVCSDEPLRQTLEGAGRRTYEEFFSPGVAGAHIERVLERIASRGQRAPRSSSSASSRSNGPSTSMESRGSMTYGRQSPL